MYKWFHLFLVIFVSTLVGFGSSFLARSYSSSSPDDRLRSADEIEWIATCALIKGGITDCKASAQQLYDMNYFPLADGQLPETIQQ